MEKIDGKLTELALEQVNRKSKLGNNDNNLSPKIIFCGKARFHSHIDPSC